MNKPVAYRVDGTIYNDIVEAEFAVREIEHFRNALGIDKDLIRRPKYIEPLYTSDQLHPRVKMTKKQHKQFEKYKVNKNNFYHFWQSLLVDDVSLFKEISERDLMLAWLDDGTIEIAPDMKWFVRSKERNSEKNYYYFVGKRPDDYWPTYGYKRAAKHFDTKEEAEKWKNPLTEAVQLPVEGY